MIRTFTRFLTQDLRAGKGVWTDFTSRAESLKAQSPHQLAPTPPNKKVYHSPPLINETFQQAYELLQQESANIYKTAQSESDPAVKDKLLAMAEAKNPEVLYNMHRYPQSLDLSQPVYRNFARKQWEGHDLLVLMQRLEQLKVIPDTMPTLVPKVDVKIKFPHNTTSEFSGWITPGEILPAFAVSQPPVIQVQHFDHGDVHAVRKYTVLVVNPDEPDLTTNSFRTTLNYGVANIGLSLEDNTLDVGKYLAEQLSVFREYEPLVPEVNSGNYQRACLWLFAQKDNADISVDTNAFNSQNFDIRQFSESYGLEAVGAHVWRQVFDRSVNRVREQYGLPSGRVFHRVRKAHPL
ncbi:PEBP-like protein, partial [Yamadazyma tenuis ATCC 10573]